MKPVFTKNTIKYHSFHLHYHQWLLNALVNVAEVGILTKADHQDLILDVEVDRGSSDLIRKLKVVIY